MSNNTLIERLNEHASYLRSLKDEGQTMIERQCIAVMSEAAQALAQLEGQQAAGEAVEICPTCNGAGGDNNVWTCPRCNGSGGTTPAGEQQ